MTFSAPTTPGKSPILTLFGTRPETIKLGPVIRELECLDLATRNVFSGQHQDLARPFIKSQKIRVDDDLEAMRPGQTANQLCAEVQRRLDTVLQEHGPSAVIVQGDTNTAMIGALAAFQRRIPIGHVEAGLRSGDAGNPFPEEMNRRLISQLATWHFTATDRNADALKSEGFAPESIHTVGNPGLDSLRVTLSEAKPKAQLEELLKLSEGMRLVVLTTHRRESIGGPMEQNLRILRDFIEASPDFSLVFPVHPNPEILHLAETLFSGIPRIHRIDPLPHDQFLLLLSHAWAIVSDSGGIQEEAPSIGTPLLIIRENTERPEAVDCGAARMVGTPELLRDALQEAASGADWFQQAHQVDNPFGDGRSGKRIADILKMELSDPYTA